MTLAINKVTALLRLVRKVLTVRRVIVSKRTADGFRRQFVANTGKQAAADDLERLLSADRLPECLNTAKVVRQGSKGLYAALTVCFFVRLWQRSQQHGIWDGFQCFSQRLHETKIRVEATASQ